MSFTNLKIIADASNVSLKTLETVLATLDPPQNLRGVELALVRLGNIIPWLNKFKITTLNQDQLRALRWVSNQQHIWKNLVKRTSFLRADIRCVTAGESVKTNPLWAAFVDKGDPCQDKWATPFLAILYAARQFPESVGINLVDCGLFVRKLFDPLDLQSTSVREYFSQNSLSADRPSNLLEAAALFPKSAWVRKVVKRLELFDIGTTPKPPGISSSKKTNGYSRIRNPIKAPVPGLDSNLPFPVKRQIIRQPCLYLGTESTKSGLSPAENGTLEEILVADAGANFDINIQAKRYRTYTAKEHQYLQFRNDHLNEFEALDIKCELDALQESEPKLALLIYLSICTGRLIKEILCIPLKSEEDITLISQLNSMAIFPTLGLLAHPAFEPENCFTPNDNQTQFLEHCSNHVLLQLPDSVVKLFGNLLSGAPSGQAIGTTLAVNESATLDQAQEWIIRIRQKISVPRASTAKLRNWGINQLLSRTQDPALLAHTFWIDTGISSQPYYANFSGQQLQDAYEKCLEPFFKFSHQSSQVNLEYRVGAKLLPTDQQLAEWITNWEQIYEASKDSKGLNQLVKRHNAYCAFVLMMTVSSTCHRRVADPHESLWNFDFETQIAIVRDKMSGSRDDGRPVVLCQEVVNQLELYVRHLQNLGHRIAAFDSRLGARIEESALGSGDLPFFFLLDWNCDLNQPPIPVQIKGNDIEAELNLPIPLNFWRTYLRTKLVEMGAPTEFVNYQLGHSAVGQEFDNPYSVLGPKDLVDKLAPYLSQLWKRLGWKLLSGLGYYPTKPQKKIHKQHTWIIGANSRSQTRKQKKVRFLSKIEALLDRFENREWSEIVLEQVLGAIEEQFSRAEAKLARHHIAIRLRKRFQVSDHLLAKSWPKSVVLPKPKPSTFNLRSMACFKSGRARRAKLDERIKSGAWLNKENEWEAICLASAIFYGGLCNIHYARQFLRTPVNSLEGFLWVDLVDTYYRPKIQRRWFVDVVTAHLYLEGFDRFGTFPGNDSCKVLDKIARRLGAKSFKQIFREARALYQFECPSMVSAYFSGDLNSASISNENWLRLITGKKPSLSATKERRFSQNQNNPRQDESVTPDYHSGRKIISNVCRIFRKTTMSSKNTSRKALKTKLEESKNSARKISPFLASWIEFILKILEEGTNKPKLKISTCRSYCLSVMSHIFEMTWELDDWSDLDSDNLTKIYHSILDCTTNENRIKNAQQLHKYHRFLAKEYRFPSVDFVEIEPRANLKSVRPGVISDDEVDLAMSWLPRGTRSAIQLGLFAQLRTEEMRRIRLEDIRLKNPTLISVWSKARASTKTASGQRQVPLLEGSSEKIADFQQFISAMTMHGSKVIGEIVGPPTIETIRHCLKKATGDKSTVFHTLRHTGISKRILEAITPPEFHPPFFNPERCQRSQEFSTRYGFGFDEDHKSRRDTWQLATIFGHASPSSMFQSYFHFMDWIGGQACNNNNVNNYELLGFLTGQPYDNLRQLKRRHPGPQLGQHLIKKRLPFSQIPPPAEAAGLENQPQISPFHNQQRPTSMRQVIEAIRLARLGKNVVAISDSLEIRLKTISRWLRNLESVESFTGCSIGTNLLLHKSWLNEDFSDPLKQIDQLLIAESNGGLFGQKLLIYFKNNFHWRDQIFLFDDLDMARKCLDTLVILGFEKKCLSVLVSKGHPVYHENPNFESLASLSGYVIKPYQVSVNARTRSANIQPGIGVQIEGDCPRNKRFPLRYELYLLLTAAWCEIGTDSELWRD